MDDLSVPFRKVASTVIEAATSSAGATVVAAGNNNGWQMWVGVVILAVIAFYFLSGATAKSGDNTSQQQQQQHQPTSAPNYLKVADEAFATFKSNRQEQYYTRAIENYMDALESGTITDSSVFGHIFNQLGLLYHEGVPQSGEGLGGVAPDAQNAIHFYRESIKKGFHGAVLPLASIYHWGLTGFEGNREVAKHLYGVVLKMGNDYEKGIAKDRLRQMLEETGQSVSTAMLEEDTGVSGNFSTANYGGNPYAETFMDIDKSPYALGKDEATKDIDEKYVDDLIQNKLGIKDGTRRDGGGNAGGKATKLTSDPQNARDHVVVNSAKQSLERLRANTHIQYDIPTTFKMIHEYMVKKSDAPQRKRDTAAQVLREMAKGISNIGYEQSKEIEALHLVWNRIHSQVYANDADKRKILMENLVNELAEAVEFGELVCPTGRLNRIIDALNHQDPLVNIQPKWAIQQMMVARAGAIQKSLLAKSSSETRDAMAATNPSARQRQLQDEFMQKVKSAIERDLTRTYVDTGMMSKDLLKTELDAWIM